MKIQPPNTLYMRTHVGNAEDPDDPTKKYEMGLANGVTPVIKSEKTGKWCEFNWNWLLNQAIEGGIDKED